ncbi:bifunctional DNA-formamidopyrimidine glycosylase/DNA-(apurinic or apyrimidinic site) lyase [Pseudogemmatithrix spongiicola]|uniref:Formamidopyrimidine-DNA glycosylase n=1 Tax=Pseudogemmatithrix spongiicola TaxID=3062599 RepID=A0AA49JY03_9BACT|nr:bifunctional DNA-formamidopyrimidine glycosylase/DNA-(apurinic or apyrimidinic site) lyase [Gemmatimonadaceae bacterium 'strain 138']WKW14139.1 bifunctional DNA-formamidopyrimidine glycosylase/DNA-(apurinic or apyrimidinic site) lyase [Gemmatimonadaceae bacterium 'strain 318']
MPELPEVEFAVRRLRRAVRGREIARLRAHHPSQRRGVTSRVAAAVAGRRVARVERRGKHQLLHLDDGALLLVHFRMDGDWVFDRRDTGLPPHARVTLDFTDGRRAVLVDPRALCTLTWHAADAHPDLGLGPEPEDPALDAAAFRARLAGRRGPIKAVLLDQSVVAGVGNIYAAESLWHARISPRAAAASLTAERAARLLDGIRAALADGHVNAGRYHRGERLIPFNVYDREGEPCPRCGHPVRRIAQAGRSTYFCSRCQAR